MPNSHSTLSDFTQFPVSQGVDVSALQDLVGRDGTAVGKRAAEGDIGSRELKRAMT